jgi:pimeloyl-ACP methyl ester carboxylesterase
MATAQINGTDIYYEDSGGDGPVVLFSHGFLMDHSMFAPQVEALAGDHRCIAWDERGFGQTPAPGPFTYWDSAADAVALLDHLGIEQAVFAGMSQGGFLSLRAALAAPDRVRALVLIDTAADVDDEATLAGYGQMMAALSSGDPSISDPVLDAVAGLILGEPDLAEVWVPQWRALIAATDITLPGGALLGRDDISDRLGEITCPVLIVHGTDDVAIAMDRARKVADAVPDCRGFVEVQGAAHAANLSHPDQVNPPLAAFLAGL